MKIIIPGAAGLVGQNLVIELTAQGFTDLVAIDKYKENLAILAELHPDITVIEADVSKEGEWQKSFENGDVVVMLQAQIGSKHSTDFIRNNIESSERVVAACKTYNIPYIVHISSSVVESVAEDDYTKTKKQQEEVVVQSGIDYCILRPTLMFGWFDRKHLGWLSRFMQKIPVFPIPGAGKIIRQPLYALDFARIIASAVKQKRAGEIYNITGREKVYYVDMIRTIRKAVKSKCWVLSIPYSVFWLLLKTYSLFSKNPPFTTDQLKALVAEDEFELIPWWEIFDIPSTPFAEAIDETFNHEVYSKYVLKF